MKHKHIISVVGVVVLVCFVVATVGCAVGEERRIADMMRKIPENARQFHFQDVEALRGDDELGRIYQNWRDYCERMLAEHGADFNDTKYTANGTLLDGGSFTYIAGDFDLGEIRDKLSSLGFVKGEYRDVEVWEGDIESLALMEDLIVVSFGQTLRDCIDVIKGDKDSLWDNQIARSIVDRLPDGIQLHYLYLPVHQPELTFLQNMKAQATLLEKKDSKTLKATLVYMYEDEGFARHAVEGMKGYEDVRRDGEFVTVTDEVDIEFIFP